ncbi:MAG TPA: glycosyltransferase family 9 protein [Terracidiphilus sp.]|nr:glycosyltransferase family 9 protein [Terracidiphilus sp.]
MHCIDQWRLNRSDAGVLSKMWQFKRTRRAALREIRALRYDIALCLYPWNPDLLDLAWTARIPVRVGFRHSVMAPLATLLVDRPTTPFMSIGAIQGELLRAILREPACLQYRRSSLPESSPEAIREVCALLGVPAINTIRYRVIHMGSGATNRELPPEFWGEVVRNRPDQRFLFTGRGSREAANIEAVVNRFENCINACDRLSWQGFVAAVRHADLLYGVESMAGHVAAAVGTRCVVAYSGLAGVARWRPDSSLATVVSCHLPCAPCNDIRGCPEMTCIRNVSPQDLLRFG